MADKIRVPVKTLLDAVSFVKPFIPDAAVLQSYTKLIWSGKSMLGQDGVVGAAVAVEVPAPGTIAVDGSRLHDFLVNFGKEDEIDLKFTDKHLILTGKNSKATLQLAPAEQVKFSPPPWPSKSQLKAVVPEFIRALQAIKFCIDTSGKAGPLGAVCLQGGFAWATDGSRAAKAPIGIDLSSNDQILIPHKALHHLGAGSETESSDFPALTGLVGSLFWFAWNNKRVWTRTIEPPFPNMESVFSNARELAKTSPAFAYDPKDIGPAAAIASSAGGYGLEGEMADKHLVLKCKGDHAEMRTTRELSKSRGSATFFADTGKLREAFSRFGRLAVCGQGVLFFFDPESRAEHVVMEMVRSEVVEKDEPAVNETAVPF